MSSPKLLRLVVASPSDTQAERDLVPGLAEELNRGIARDHNLHLEVTLWETAGSPGFHPLGPQGRMDSILDIDNCDLLIGIFWKRFGTPVYDAQSGTEHEFWRAYRAWKEQGRPQILMYFNGKAATPKTSEEAEQWMRVLQFREAFPQEGLAWEYDGEQAFERLLRQHLTQHIREFTPGKATPRPAVVSAPGLPESLRLAYLHWVIAQVRHVPLTGVDPQSAREETRRDIDLAAVYTALMTQSSRRQMSALAVLNANKHLALLGEPGSGKSTFVNFVALCLAGELLGLPDVNLATLCAPVPDAARASDGQRPQPWEHGALLPLHVVLRDFVARGLAGPQAPSVVTGDTLWHFIITELPETLRSIAGPLRATLQQHGGLLLLDGLDEVPEAEQRRVQVKTAVEQFAAAFPRVCILGTSRTYAYQRQDWKLRDFAEAVLAPFDQAQIARFVERWYAYVGHLRRLSSSDAQGRAARLNDAIQRTPRLYELATRPLLLTLMASLHAWRGGSLPEQREELYADAVALLLDQWESQKLRRLPDGTYELLEPSLAEWLAVDQQAVRQMLNRLAFVAHRDQQLLTGTADIAQEALVQGLMALNLNPDARPGRLIEYLRDRAGLLEPRGVGVYAFPHRTFQEYLAACYLTDHGFPDDLAALFRAEPNRWREVMLLAGAKAARGTATASWLLAEELCATEPPALPTAEVGYLGALLATQMLLENRSLEQVAARNRPKQDRIRRWLAHGLVHKVPSGDQRQIKQALVDLGDSRFRADAWYLPDEPLLGFVEIPAGAFQMGSDKHRDRLALDNECPLHQLTLSGYYMARYPVTLAQFRAFVATSGYKPVNTRSLEGVYNHPVVYVSWHDAWQYCRWLTDCLRDWDATPPLLAALLREQAWQVMLPSEAEWEKAARGSDGRLYPWGDTFDAARGNLDETRLRTTSAVGCFPSGASPYGLLDMSGNVWEWTRSLWGRPYPYEPDAGREPWQVVDDSRHVLRGGAFWIVHQNARCAARNDHDARDVFYYVGFRVVVRPGSGL